MMNTVYLGIGTNIGDRMKNLQSAVNALAHLPGTKVTDASDVYETEPWGFTQQDNFYNICVKVATDLSPHAMLGACLGIEAAFGRERPFKNSPRTIDIDVLLYNDVQINTVELTLPHPRIGERAFVLVPLKDVFSAMETGNIDFNFVYKSCDKKGIFKVNEYIKF